MFNNKKIYVLHLQFSIFKFKKSKRQYNLIILFDYSILILFDLISKINKF